MLRGARGRNSGVGTQAANCAAPERTSPTSRRNHATRECHSSRKGELVLAGREKIRILSWINEYGYA